ncbi:DUF6036 family nucleotidyltransferase [Mycobacterium kansasii]|uniref:DUF6036 family nucleotidyltransferase n=1 Tax=Mycobacterium kansasii TaxID=1768 RepID=UPI0004DA5168|nr:DUF6036 family nucleotidyltransferase [Mycobacterium kansasii]KEP42274.1 hypothetical protein MKSMC1_25660 [Mycobacterium kansasii]
MLEFNPLAILETLARHDVNYVLIGGYAALLQGSGTATIDIDIVPARPTPNLANLAAALSNLEAKIRAEGEALPFSASAESLQGISVLNMTTRFGDLDLTFAPSGFADGFEALQADATQMSVRGVRVLVASVTDIIVSKEAAGRDKDIQALPGLLRLRQAQQQQTAPDKSAGLDID